MHVAAVVMIVSEIMSLDTKRANAWCFPPIRLERKNKEAHLATARPPNADITRVT